MQNWDNMDVFTSELMEHKDEWLWTSLVMQPDFITQQLVDEAISQLKEKKKELPSVKQIRFEKFKEGRCAQILHLGPFSEEGPTIEKLHAFIEELGGSFDGLKQKHHEIYLSDPRRTKPEKLRTIIRQPYV